MLISIIVMYYDGGGSSSESNEEKPWRHGSSFANRRVVLKMIVYEEIVYFLVRGVFMIRM